MFDELKQIDSRGARRRIRRGRAGDGPTGCALARLAVRHPQLRRRRARARDWRAIASSFRISAGTARRASCRTTRSAERTTGGRSRSTPIALMDALGIESAIIAGFDWGARSANVVAALWPDRCKAMVSVSGYLIGSQEANKTPLPPAAELQWWYQYYFATERGRPGYSSKPARVREAHLAHRVARVELRRRDLRSQRGRLRQPGSRRHRHQQLPLAARVGGRRTAVRRARGTVGRWSGHHGADDHAGR